jgi:membrane-associated protein
MDFLQGLLDLFLHLDDHLAQIIRDFGPYSYLILFLIVFTETGLVVMPFLPGDSLLFAAGTLAGLGQLSLPMLYLVFFAGALVGDNVNYFVGKFLGPKLFREGRKSRFLKRQHLDKTHAFFEKYGGKTIIIARFVPIVRTFAPFTAGLGAMQYRHFIGYSVLGAVLWVGSCVTLGYYFGTMPVIKKNFSIAVIVVILISLLPAVVEVVKHRRMRAEPPSAEEATIDATS